MERDDKKGAIFSRGAVSKLYRIPHWGMHGLKGITVVDYLFIRLLQKAIYCDRFISGLQSKTGGTQIYGKFDREYLFIDLFYLK